jgi:hypothetical protein
MTWYEVLALLSAPGGIIVALIEKTRRENNRDHAKNAELLHRIDGKVDKIDTRLDHHIEWHLDKDNERRV